MQEIRLVSHCHIHTVVAEFASCGLGDAEEHDIGADGHEGDVQVRGINILPWGLVPVTPTDLHMELRVSDRYTPVVTRPLKIWLCLSCCAAAQFEIGICSRQGPAAGSVSHCQPPCSYLVSKSAHVVSQFC